MCCPCPPNRSAEKKIPKSKRVYTAVTHYGYTPLRRRLIAVSKEVVIVRLIWNLRQSVKSLLEVANHSSGHTFKCRIDWKECMSIEKLTLFAIKLAVLAKVINATRGAQVQLIQESKASKWPKAETLPPFTRPSHF